MREDGHGTNSDSDRESLISVIIPVYHCRSTLRAAAESVLGQSYGNTELLLVPNGRDEDGSGAMCDKIAGRDSRVRIVQCEKKGVSAARNEGIRQAAGGMIAFLDSDDIMPEGALLAMAEAMKRDGSGLVIAGFDHLYFGHKVRKHPRLSGCIDPGTDRETMKQLYTDGFLNMPWNKLYRRDRIDALFPEDLSLGEDLCFNQEYILNARRITVLQESVCVYLQNERQESLSGGRRDDRIEVCLRLYRESKRFFIRLWKLKKGQQDQLSFLDDKVVGTFLDELGLLGVSGHIREKTEEIDAYAAAILRFTCGGKKKITFEYPDHRLIYRAVLTGNRSLLRCLLSGRGALVRVKRKLQREGRA